jgi:hypothetical protein
MIAQSGEQIRKPAETPCFLVCSFFPRGGKPLCKSFNTRGYRKEEILENLKSVAATPKF